MSANDTGSGDDPDGVHETFTFECKIPVQSYLIAIAVGDL